MIQRYLALIGHLTRRICFYLFYPRERKQITEMKDSVKELELYSFRICSETQDSCDEAERIASVQHSRLDNIIGGPSNANGGSGSW